MDVTTIFTSIQEGLSITMSNYSLGDILIIFLGTFVLSLWIGFLYRLTHKGGNYNQGYVQTLVLMGGIIAMIMLIVGSDVAKAFTMMGAFSIIRFRNNMKETKDIGFVFLVMAIGMAMGTKLYFLAGVATLVMSVMIYLMYRFNWFVDKNVAKLLTIRISPKYFEDGVFDSIFKEYWVKAEFLSCDGVKKEDLIQISFRVILSKETKIVEFISALQEKNNNEKVSLNYLT